MRPRLSVVGAFFLRALAIFVPLLALWYFARAWFVWPTAWFAGHVMQALFPDWVRGYAVNEAMMALETVFRTSQSEQLVQLSPEVNVSIYAYGLPLFVALLLASRARGLWWKIPAGAIALVPFQAWSVCFAFLVAVAFNAAQVTSFTTGFGGALQMNFFALGYQLGSLVLPTLVPLLTWAVLERRFIATVAVDGALTGSVESDRADRAVRRPF